MLGPLAFRSPLREIYCLESSTMQFQWSENSCKQTGGHLRSPPAKYIYLAALPQLFR